MRKWVLSLCAVAVLAGACAPGSRSLEVGAVYPTGGTQGPGGIEELRGVELAAELLNADGGVNGRRLVVRAERTDTGDAAPQAVEHLTRRGVPVILGSYGSTISLPAARAASRRGVVFWETGAVGELGMATAPGDLTFRFPATGQSLGRGAVSFVRDRLHPGRDLRYAVAYVDDVYGRPVARGAIEEIGESGQALVADIPYDLATADYGEIARRVGEADAEVLMVVAYLEDGVALREAIVEQGIELVENIGTSSSYCMIEFGQRLGDDAVGLFASDKPSGDHLIAPDALDGPAAELLARARDAYHERYDAPMTAPALSGFAAAWALFGHVLPEADELTAQGIADAARRVVVPQGVLPNGSGLEFGAPGTPAAGENVRATSVIWEWVAPQERAIVWPPAFATPGLVR